MFFEPVTLQEVLKNLRSGAAVGHGGTCILVVKDCVELDVICEPFTKIINRSLISGVVPTKMKIARVISVHTSGDCNQFTHYRPVSVNKRNSFHFFVSSFVVSFSHISLCQP